VFPAEKAQPCNVLEDAEEEVEEVAAALAVPDIVQDDYLSADDANDDFAGQDDEPVEASVAAVTIAAPLRRSETSGGAATRRYPLVARICS
jgi:hypothetical protein